MGKRNKLDGHWVDAVATRHGAAARPPKLQGCIHKCARRVQSAVGAACRQDGSAPAAAGSPSSDGQVISPQAQTDQQTANTQLCSSTALLSREHQEYVHFVNNTPYTVRVLWLDYKGFERPYEVIRPGGAYTQHTYFTHPWVVREQLGCPSTGRRPSSPTKPRGC